MKERETEIGGATNYRLRNKGVGVSAFVFVFVCPTATNGVCLLGAWMTNVLSFSFAVPPPPFSMAV